MPKSRRSIVSTSNTPSDSANQISDALADGDFVVIMDQADLLKGPILDLLRHVVMDQGQVDALPGYVPGETWLHTSNDNLMAQLADGETLPTFFPFNKEIHSTIYYPGTVEISVSGGRLTAIRPESPARVSGTKF